MDTQQQNARDMRNRIFRHMLEKRGWKYRAFLRYLRVFKYVTLAPLRGEILEYYYTLMRYLDDIADGDAPLPPGYDSVVTYIEDKIRFSLDPANPRDEADHLLVYCFQLASRLKMNIQSETADILGSLLFDAKRKGRNQVFRQEELEHHFHLLDIRGTIQATLKVFHEDPAKYPLLEPIGTATRFQYDVEDMENDIRQGFINITQEEFKQLNLSPEAVFRLDPDAMLTWQRHRSTLGLQLLQQHRELLPQGKFSPLVKATLYFVYERPARSVFESILAGKPLKGKN